MSYNEDYNSIDTKILETWVKGWSLAREVTPPIPFNGGFRVNVGWPQQLVRYVFPKITPGLLQLAQTIYEPWQFLKVCAPPKEVSTYLPSRWRLQPAGFMMISQKPMSIKTAELPKGYKLHRIENRSVPIIKVLTSTGAVAAIGRIAVVDEYAIYDRIETLPQHRRLGLASVVMKTL